MRYVLPYAVAVTQLVWPKAVLAHDRASLGVNECDGLENGTCARIGFSRLPAVRCTIVSVFMGLFLLLGWLLGGRCGLVTVRRCGLASRAILIRVCLGCSGRRGFG